MTSGSPAYLVDTNVLVYAYDAADPTKRDRAIAVLEHLYVAGRGVLVLGEFFVTVTRKLNPPLTPSEAERSIRNYRRSWPVLDLLPEDVSTAVRVVRQHKMAYWDALIWSTAKRAGLRAVLSEDFQDGRRLEGIHFLNPLVDRFELQLLT